ncbi:MAG: TrmH family RNA methyltransferase [Limnochordia bacterium]
MSSRQNPLIKGARKLLRRKHREETGQFLLEGPKALEEVVAAGCPPGILFYLPTIDERQLVPFQDWQLVKTAPQVFQTISDTTTSQGLIGLLEKPRATLDQVLSPKGTLWLILDGIQDPGNMGTMLRTAVAAGCHGVILTKGTVDPFNPKAARASAGALYRIPLVSQVDPWELVEACERAKIPLLGTAPRAPKSYFDIDLRSPVAIVIGNEGQGMGEELASQAELVHIPQAPGLDSLNAAVAAGVLLYEVIRQRRGESPALY